MVIGEISCFYIEVINDLLLKTFDFLLYRNKNRCYFLL